MKKISIIAGIVALAIGGYALIMSTHTPALLVLGALLIVPALIAAWAISDE